MGWGKFFGDIAKDLASDYFTNRGVEGIKEDLGSVANGVKSLFGSSDNESDDFWDTYNSLIENADYSTARKLVNEYFEEDKKSYLYHYLLAKIDYQRGLDNATIEKGLRILQEAKCSITKAYNNCPIATDDQEVVIELKNDIESSISVFEELKESLAEWDKLIDKKDGLLNLNVSLNELKELSTEFLDHYKKYEEGELDYHYWINISDIHYQAHAIVTTKEEKDYYYKEFQRDLDNALSLAENDADRVSDITARRAWEKDMISEKQSSPHVSEVESDQDKKEKEYLAEIKMCLEDDGTISDRERRILNRLRQSLGISEERAAELESSLNTSVLTESEQEYADEIRACLEDDGEISAKERRLLDKLRNSLGISPERAAEIEMVVISK